MNGAELTPSLWLYAIHSNNAELIHLIESNEVAPPTSYSIENKESENEVDNSSKNYEQCLIESIKCHHNDIADYIENNLMVQNEIDNQKREELFSNYIKYHNYSHLQTKTIIDHGFFYLYSYHYDRLFELLLNKKEKSIKNKMIQYPNIEKAVQNNEIEVTYFYLLEVQKISGSLFNDTKIKQIAIPSSVTSIGNDAFSRCSLLTQIIIPSSVTSIEEGAFSKCSSLTQITIPSSVTSIGSHAFSGCLSLPSDLMQYINNIKNNKK